MSAFSNPSARKLASRGAGAVTAVVFAGLLLSGCGAGTESGDAAKTPASSTDRAFNDADVTFAQAMIPHHQQALEMARLANGRAEDAGVKKIVADVEKAQDPEIRTMRSWLKAWGKPEAPAAPEGSAASGGHGGGHGGGGDAGGSMAGMMSEQDMKELAALRGKAFDRKFAELMIAHHEGAVEMAEAERKNGRDATARKLADDVVRTQSAEITELKKILGRL
ncbi:DUF305 domain-containing protein [Streptomyces sp. NPDC058579]|uniref:DUF305 domain-containing protein n=1 Tax=Streptomyces sp. NPDC058579 TaxID=3346548 RepID=UPI0036511CEF